MESTRKKMAIISFMVMAIIFIMACEMKSSQSGYDYPRSFSQACIDYHDELWIVLEKMRYSERFNERSLETKEQIIAIRLMSMKLLEKQDDPKDRELRIATETYFQDDCKKTQQLLQKWSSAMSQAENLSDHALQEATGISTRK